ncbi:MAG: hypothetical protein K0S60_572 [Evtepia sp.]|jgi:hypothetical protein|nr:hypothetical protein [Evtepia sp.]
MTAENFWNLFYKTGLPVCYTLYRHVKQAEEKREANQAVKSA